MLLSSDGKTSLEFLSTPSARRATGKRWPQRQADCHFYPRPPRGGRHELHRENQQYKQFLSTPSARRATARKSGFPATRRISIHALREEGDAGACDARAAPYCISIHALREEGDFGISCILHVFYNFYPRPPRGGRPTTPKIGGDASSFLSTPSARRATGDDLLQLLRLDGFLSTPSARRATVRSGLPRSLPRDFYPRPPRGGRRVCFEDEFFDIQFLSTPSARRATDASHAETTVSDISIHALREEGDAPSSPLL